MTARIDGLFAGAALRSNAPSGDCLSLSRRVETVGFDADKDADLFIDPETMIYTRRLFEFYLRREWRRARRNQDWGLSVLIVTIDAAKASNLGGSGSDTRCATATHDQIRQ